MRIELTQDWPYEEIAQYGPEITAAMRKLVARFPRQFTVESLFRDISEGRNQLWLILDGEGAFKAFVMTEVFVNKATGEKTVLLTEGAGEGGPALAQVLPVIEQWAIEQKADAVLPMARRGWEREISKYGYRPEFVRYRKDLPHGDV